MEESQRAKTLALFHCSTLLHCIIHYEKLKARTLSDSCLQCYYKLLVNGGLII